MESLPLRLDEFTRQVIDQTTVVGRPLLMGSTDLDGKLGIQYLGEVLGTSLSYVTPSKDEAIMITLALAHLAGAQAYLISVPVEIQNVPSKNMTFVLTAGISLVSDRIRAGGFWHCLDRDGLVYNVHISDRLPVEVELCRDFMRSLPREQESPKTWIAGLDNLLKRQQVLVL